MTEQTYILEVPVAGSFVGREGRIAYRLDAGPVPEDTPAEVVERLQSLGLIRDEGADA